MGGGSSHFGITRLVTFSGTGLIDSAPFQRWDGGTATASLDLGNSGANTADMKFTGNMPVMRTNGDLSSGLRTYASSSAFWVEAGTSAQSAMNLIFAGNRQATGTSAQFNFASATFASAVQVLKLGIGTPPTAATSHALEVAGRTRFVTLDKSLTSSQPNFDIGDATIIRLSATSVFTIGGFTNGVPGRVLRVINVGTIPVLLTNENAPTSAANRFTAPNGVDTSFAPKDTIDFVYDGTTLRWRIVRWASVSSDETIKGAVDVRGPGPD